MFDLPNIPGIENMLNGQAATATPESVNGAAPPTDITQLLAGMNQAPTPSPDATPLFPSHPNASPYVDWDPSKPNGLPPAAPSLGGGEFGPLFDLDPTADYQSPYDFLDPLHTAFANERAKQSGTSRAINGVMNGAANGDDVDTQDKKALQNALDAHAQKLYGSVAHLNNDEFTDWLHRWQTEKGMAPQIPTGLTKPQTPNLLSLLLSGIIASKHGAQAGQILAAPFNGAQDQFNQQRQVAYQDYNAQNQAYNQNMDGLGTEGRMISQRDQENAQLQNDAIQRDNGNVQHMLSMVSGASSPEELSQAYQAMKAAGYGDLIPQDQQDKAIAAAQSRIDAGVKTKSDAQEYGKQMDQIKVLIPKAYNPKGGSASRVSALKAIAAIYRQQQNEEMAQQYEADIPAQSKLSDEEMFAKQALGIKQQTQNTKDKVANAQVNKLSKEAELIATKNGIAQKDLAHYDQNFQAKMAYKMIQVKNVESEISRRGLMGNAAYSKAQRGALGGGDIKALNSAKSAYASMRSGVLAQMNQLKQNKYGSTVITDQGRYDALQQQADALQGNMAIIDDQIAQNTSAKGQLKSVQRGSMGGPLVPPMQGPIGNGRSIPSGIKGVGNITVRKSG